MKRKLVILGAGGAGVEAAWVWESRGKTDLDGRKLDLVGFADDDQPAESPGADGPNIKWTIESALRELDPAEVVFHCAIGNNSARERVAEEFLAKGFSAATLAHVTAVVADSAEVAQGSYLGAHVVIAPGARIGEFCLLNTQAAIGHHSILDSYCQVSPGAKISGYCSLGRRAFVGSNAVILPKGKVGIDAVVAASSLVLKSVPAGATVIGIPARSLRARSPADS